MQEGVGEKRSGWEKWNRKKLTGAIVLRFSIIGV